VLQGGRSRFRLPIVSLEFFVYIILPDVLWPWGRLSLSLSDRNEYREVGLRNLPLSRAVCLEVWQPLPHGNLRSCSGLYRDCFTFTFNLNNTLFTSISYTTEKHCTSFTNTKLYWCPCAESSKKSLCVILMGKL